MIFTFIESNDNLCDYIEDNYQYLLPDWTSSYNPAGGLVLRYEDRPYVIVHMYLNFIIRDNNEPLHRFIKVFNIPDFHAELIISTRTGSRGNLRYLDDTDLFVYRGK